MKETAAGGGGWAGAQLPHRRDAEPMAWRTGGALLVVLGAVAGLFLLGNVLDGDKGPCGDPPVLAAPSAPVFATSCVDALSYEGTTYYVTCLKVHPSRVGERFLRDGGDTYFEGARDIQGIPREDAFILEGAPCRRDTTVAMSESPTRSKVKLLERHTAGPEGSPPT